MRDVKVLAQWLLVGGLFVVTMSLIGLLANPAEPKRARNQWIESWDEFAQIADLSGARARRSNARAASIAFMFLGGTSAAIGYALRAGSPQSNQAPAVLAGSVEDFASSVGGVGQAAIRALQNYSSTFEAKSHVQTIMRPTGVALIAMYASFSGALSLLFATLAVAVGLSVSTALYAIVSMAFGIASLLAAYGLWNLLPLGYHLSVVIHLLAAPLNLLMFIFGQKTASSLVFAIASVLTSVYILRYLSSSLTRSHFILDQAGPLDSTAQADI
jgi:hypothetical protein